MPPALPRPVAAALLLALPVAGAAPAAGAGDPGRGAYLAAAAGCYSCHTDTEADGPAYAGGAPIRSPFGTFLPPNITADPEHGIGGWSEAEFVRAVREGRRPDGAPYYPAFPYPSYAGMTGEDARDLYAFFMTVEPVPRPSPGHDLRFPFSVRLLLWPWRFLYFDPSPDLPPGRGAYLALALGHCGECHTPRNILGAPRESRAFAGAVLGDGDGAPNITSHPDDGIGGWSEADLRFFLKIGLGPDGDAAGGEMALVVEHSTSRLTDADLDAMVAWFRALPPLAGGVVNREEGGEDF